MLSGLRKRQKMWLDNTQQWIPKVWEWKWWWVCRSRERCLFIFTMSLKKERKSQMQNMLINASTFGIREEVLKGLTFPFWLSYRKWTQILKRDIRWQAQQTSEAVREVPSLGKGSQNMHCVLRNKPRRGCLNMHGPKQATEQLARVL